MKLSQLQAKIEQYIKEVGDDEIGSLDGFDCGLTPGYKYEFQPEVVNIKVIEGVVRRNEIYDVHVPNRFVSLFSSYGGEAVPLDAVELDL